MWRFDGLVNVGEGVQGYIFSLLASILHLYRVNFLKNSNHFQVQRYGRVIHSLHFPFQIPHKNFQPLGFVEGISIFNVV